MSTSDFLENELINATLRGQAYASPATVYTALFTTDPTDNDTGIEVAGAGYARISTAFDAPVNGACVNSADVTFLATGGGFGTVTHTGLYDALTGGNLLYHAALTTPQTVNDGQTLSFLAGQIQVKLT